MEIGNKIRGKKLQYNINREASKILALLSGRINEYQHLKSEEILPSNQRRVIEQAKFTYSPLEKVLEKHTKTIEDQGKKQIKATEDDGN